MNHLSQRIQFLSESQTLAMARRCRELQAKGIDVINLSIGEPDFNTPDFIKDAAKKALDENYTKYTPVSGYADLKKAISEKFKRDNGLEYTPEEIVVSTGAKQSIANVVLSTIDPGDEVIVPIPYWVSYIEMIKLAGGTPVYIHTNVGNNFKFTPAELEKTITPRTKLLMFSTPCNPSGTVYSREELAAIVKVLEKHPRIVVISDEIYEHINFIGKHVSIGSFKEIKDRVVTVNGVSKGFAMTGWRIGFLGATLELAKACEKMQGQITSGTCSIAQRAALAAVNADPSVVEPMRIKFLQRRDLVLGLLKDVKGFKCNVPEGAFYVFPDISELIGKKAGDKIIGSSADLCNFILEKGHVALVSGDAFGDDTCIRISYATSEDKLIEAVKRIREAVDLLN